MGAMPERQQNGVFWPPPLSSTINIYSTVIHSFPVTRATSLITHTRGLSHIWDSGHIRDMHNTQ